MRKIVVFTMILTVNFAMAGCTAHSEPGKKAAESSTSNVVFDIAQAEELTEKTITETVEKSKFIAETKQPTVAKTDTENVSKEPIFSQTTTANTEPKQDTHTQKEPTKSEKSELEIAYAAPVVQAFRRSWCNDSGPVVHSFRFPWCMAAGRDGAQPPCWSYLLGL